MFLKLLLKPCPTTPRTAPHPQRPNLKLFPPPAILLKLCLFKSPFFSTTLYSYPCHCSYSAICGSRPSLHPLPLYWKRWKAHFAFAFRGTRAEGQRSSAISLREPGRRVCWLPIGFCSIPNKRVKSASGETDLFQQPCYFFVLFCFVF